MADQQAPPAPTIAPRNTVAWSSGMVGYYIFTTTESNSFGSAATTSTIWPARCRAPDHTWSSVEGTGVCATTRDDGEYMNYSRGTSCRGTVVVGTYTYAYSTTGASWYSSDYPFTETCTSGDVCNTFTIYQASPSVGPSLVYIGCGRELDLPKGYHATIYSEFPSSGQITPDPDDSSSPSSDSSSGPNAGLIAGAVVGSIAGIVLIALAFVLGWKLSAKRKKDTEAAGTTNEPAAQQPFDKPELDGTSPVQASAVAPFGGDSEQQNQQRQQQQLADWAQNQPAWPQQAGAYYYYPPPGNVAELPPSETRIQELLTEVPPQELPGSPQSAYQGQPNQPDTRPV
ncbi:hypothetical protein VTJ04DRAFT_1037 [Mycothermus thermophilus]|uniref:uncharacterized protein n=1 Tax=Humicola insolens TaxID=85995 RepID=UPI003742012E